MKRRFILKKYSFFGNKRFKNEIIRREKYKKLKNQKIKVLEKNRYLHNLSIFEPQDSNEQNKSTKILRKRDYKSVIAPVIFSLKENIDEMLDFYEKIYENAKIGQGTNIDMSKVNYVSADALLYSLSIFNSYKQNLKYSRIKGNLPNDTLCRELIVESGFLDYFYLTAEISPIKNPDILKIKSGSKVHGSVIDNILTFAELKLGLNNDKEKMKSEGIYSSLIECMNNTVEHAYKSVKGKWWLISLYNNDKKKVNFTFLDNGLGIPKTVQRKYFSEKLLGKFIPTDAKIIKSTLEGDFRTKTEDAWRGKGLPSIYDSFKKKQIDNLLIISNNGFFKCDEDLTTNLKMKFRGTLLNLDLNKY
jgi:hypothetical protein